MNPSSHRRPWSTALCRLVVVLIGVVMVSPLWSGSAAAHAALASSNPAEGAPISTAPERVTLTFNEAIQSAYAALTVTGPEGNQWGRGDIAVEGRDVSVALADGGLGAARQYTVAFRVVSADGHPIQGSYGFELTTERGGNSSPKTGADAAVMSEPSSEHHAAPAGGGDESPEVPAWIPVGAGLVVLGGALAYFLFGRREGRARGRQ